MGDKTLGDQLMIAMERSHWPSAEGERARALVEVLTTALEELEAMWAQPDSRQQQIKMLEEIYALPSVERE